MMNADVNAVVVLVTCETLDEAKSLSRTLVEEKLVACVNRIGPIASVYSWQGKVEEAEEYLLVMKTMQEALETLIPRVKALHSYTVPEVIALPIIAGSSDYLRWIVENIHL